MVRHNAVICGETIEFADILAKAEIAAREAAAAKDATLPPEQQRGFDCGFAWVIFRPATHPFIRWCRELASNADRRNVAASVPNYGSRHHAGGWSFWCTGYAPTQSIDVHHAAAEAFATVLRGYFPGEISVGSRLD